MSAETETRLARELTEDEQRTMDMLKDAWNLFVALPRVHPDELVEFRHKFHDLQRIVMSRPFINLGPTSATLKAEGR